MPDDGWAHLLVVSARMNHVIELRTVIPSQDRSSEPYRKPLERVRYNVDVDGLWLMATQLLALAKALVDDALDATLKTPSKILEHRTSTREAYVFVQPAARVDGRLLYRLVNNVGQRSGVVRV